LGVLLFFGTLPKDFVHQFADHHDTVHSSSYGHDGPVIEQQHHHCDYIDYALTPFAYVPFSFNPVFTEPPFFTYPDVPVAGHHSEPGLHTALRGPPAFLV